MADINVTIAERETISATITDKEIITVIFEGGSGTMNHASLNNLDFENSGHEGFQKKIGWDDDYNSFLIDKT